MTSVSNKRLVVSFSHWLLRWIPCHTICGDHTTLLYSKSGRTYTIKARFGMSIFLDKKQRNMAFARLPALVTAELICALGFKSSVTVMPKSVPILVTFRTLFQICKLESGTILLPIFTTEHLLTEILNSHTSSQLANASSACCSCCTSQLFKTRI